MLSLVLVSIGAGWTGPQPPAMEEPPLVPVKSEAHEGGDSGAAMAQLLPGPEPGPESETNMVDIVSWTIHAHGGPLQLVRAALPEASLPSCIDYLDAELPDMPGVEMWSPGKPLDNSPVRCRVRDFGFDVASSTKPPPVAAICLRLAQEMDKDGFVTGSEPMRAFLSENKLPPFQLGHVKGSARHSTLLACLLFLHQRGLSVQRILPHVFHTARAVLTVIEQHQNLTSVALRNAQLSARGSIRRAHCAVTWAGKLLILQQHGQDAASVVKQYNEIASSGAQLTGQRRVSVLQLLKAPLEALNVVLECVSTLGADGSPLE